MRFLIVLVVIVGSLQVRANQLPAAKPLNYKVAPIKSLIDLKLDPGHACNSLVKKNNERTDVDQFQLQALIENCLGDLVPREIFWESMVSDEVTTLYRAVDNYLYPNSQSEDHVKLWRVFHRSILQRENFKSGVRKYFSRWFDKGSLSMLPQTCRRLRQAFEPIATYFSAAELASGNSALTLKMAIHDENLFMVSIVYKSCEVLLD